MFLYAPASLVETIFNRIPNAGEPFQIRRIKAEEVGLLGGFDEKSVTSLHWWVVLHSICLRQRRTMPREPLDFPRTAGPRNIKKSSPWSLATMPPLPS